MSKRTAVACLGAFALLLVGLPLVATWTSNAYVSLIDIFYRAGSLVFGGGHVVLPLLQAETASLVEPEVFLAGYGAAQAVPGPLFTVAGFLGASSFGTVTGIVGALAATVAIFLPAALLVVGTLPFWEALRGNAATRRVLTGVNAGVVGILGAALYDPLFTAGILGNGVNALVLAVAAFVALHSWKVPAWAVVIAAGILGWAVF